jgi:alanine dehydrogenase
MPLILSQKILKQLLTMGDVIDAVEQGFKEHKTGTCTVPVRMSVGIQDHGGMFLFMPAYVERRKAFGTKVVSVFPGNLSRGLSTIQATYMLNDPTTGEFLALMEGGFLTAMRTGAASAVATKYLAREETHVLGVIGAGGQALFQAEGICAVRPIQRILVYDKVPEKAENFAVQTSRNLSVPAQCVESPREVVIQSDVLVTVTTSKEPVFDGRDLRPGTHINAVGAYTSEMRELDDVTVTRARIVVDTYEGCMAEAGDLLIPMREGKLTKDRVQADLGEVILGHRPGRVEDDDVTLFESVGFALEDVVTAHLAYQRAQEQDLGLRVNLAESA